MRYGLCIGVLTTVLGLTTQAFAGPETTLRDFAGSQVKRACARLAFKLDLAYLYNLAAARTGNIFGKRNTSLIGTLVFDYEGAAKQLQPL